VGRLMAAAVARCRADRIAGIPYAGLPLAVAASLAGGFPLIYPRREEKAYGTRRRIEGTFHPGERVVVIDDIVTDGASKLEAIAPLEAAGLVIEDLIVLIDREQGARERLAQKGYCSRSPARSSAPPASPDARGASAPTSKISVSGKVATRTTPDGGDASAAASRARSPSGYWPRFTIT